MHNTNKRPTLGFIIREIFAHFWFSALAVICGVGLLFLLDKFFIGLNYKAIFHNFHYAHIFFASATATLIGNRFCHSLKRSLLVGIFIPPIFCTASDIFIPYLGGLLSGQSMKLHLCILHNKVFWIGLILAGAAFGALLGRLKSKNVWTACVTSHFLHDFVSTVSSLGYMASFGFFAWKTSLIYTTLFTMITVLVPCMISDIVLPVLLCADQSNKCNLTHCCTGENGRN